MDTVDLGRYLLSLLAVVALVVVMGYAAKRLGLANKMRHSKSLGGTMEVVDMLYLDPRRKLMLVRCREQEFLLLMAGDTASVVSEMKGNM